MTPVSGTGAATATPGTDSSNVFQKLRQAALNAAADALNLSSNDLSQQLQSGKSLNDVATAQGVDPSKVQSAISDAVQSQVNQDVQDGQLTSNQAQNILQNFMTQFSQTGQAQGAHGHHHHGHHHHGGGGGAQESAGSNGQSQVNIDVLVYSAQGDSVTPGQSNPSGQQFNASA